ncbi:MAG: hypothetical protein PHQ40_00860 [Anaerolineaceae bacterium]|nr:hypothetical protein [Anaerolineaceae bacterium]
MKKIGLFVLFAAILTACGTSENTGNLARAQNVVEAGRAAQGAARAGRIAAQGVSDVSRGQTLILSLVTLIIVVLLSLAAYLVIRRLIRILRTFRQLTTGATSMWLREPNARWRKPKEADLNQQIFIEQQWLWTQLLSQSHEDADSPDFLDLPHDWWS